MSSTSLPLLRSSSSIPPPSFKQPRSTLLINNYDPAAYPPDLQFARQHGKAQRIGKVNNLREEEGRRCRCCLQFIQKQEFPICGSVDELKICSESFPLYFYFYHCVLILLLFNTVILCIPSTILNSLGSTCQSLSDPSPPNSICTLSIINIMSTTQLDHLQVAAFLYFFVILLNVILIAWLQYKMEKLQQNMRNEEGAERWSVLLKGMPKDITIYEIQKYVEDKLMYIGAPDTTVVKIYLIYNFKSYQALYQKKRENIQQSIALQNKIKQISIQLMIPSSINPFTLNALRLEYHNLSVQLSELDNTLQMIEIQITKFEQTMNSMASRLANEGKLEDQGNILKFSGKCIVTVNNIRSKELLVQSQGQKSLWKLWAYKIGLFLEGRKATLIINDAPEPQDIIFSNMGSKKIIVWKNRIFYTTLLAFLMLLDLLIVTLTKKFLKEEKAIQQQNIIFSVINSIVIAGFCSIFRRIIRASQLQSYHTTKSSFCYAVVSKVVIIFIINMLLTTFLANVASFYFFHEDKATFQVFPLNFQAFLYDCFFLMITNPLMSLVLIVFDHRQLTKLIKRFRIQRGLPVSQIQANLAFQNQPFDLTYKYSTIYRFTLFTAAISVLYPLSFLICLGYLCVIYWMDRIMISKRYSLGEKVGKRHVIRIITILSQIPVYIALMNFLIMFVPVMAGAAFEQQQYSKAYYYMSISALIFALVVYIFGNQWIKAIFRRISSDSTQNNLNSPLYKDIEQTLHNDYSHDYPYFRVNQKIGIDRQNSQSIRKDKIKEMRMNENLGVFDVVKAYLNQRRYAQQL